MEESTKRKPKKTTLYIDQDLLDEAKAALGAGSDTETVHAGLRAVVRSAAYQRSRALLGSEKGRPVYDVPRRREGTVAKRKTRTRKTA
jgi:Arc/MetJ family transcription regulator